MCHLQCMSVTVHVSYSLCKLQFVSEVSVLQVCTLLPAQKVVAPVQLECRALTPLLTPLTARMDTTALVGR